jgi:hypothetical protein
MKRLVLIAFVALGLAPGTWWRSPTPPGDRYASLVVTPVAVDAWSAGGVRLLGAWRLESSNRHFHGYSALAILDDGTLLAASDRGRKLILSPPGTREIRARMSAFAGAGTVHKGGADIEALARDPASGRLWIAYEGTNAIARHRRDFGVEVRVAPLAMRDWPSNAGPETMARLADGRFIVLSEGDPSYFAEGAPGLLFPADPVEGAAPVAFRFRPPEGFSPVDMAQLPDGRTIILMRRVDWGLPPGFSGKLAVADPDTIAEGEPWTWHLVADLGSPLPLDNYEGLAVQPNSGGEVILWLISDDNESRLQRTLLLKLSWRPDEKARGADRARR